MPQTQTDTPFSLRTLGALALACALAACGGGGGGGSSPAAPATPAPTPTPAEPSAATITITASGVDPKSVTIPVGGRVTFTNRDGVAHEMASDPHPLHTDCPEINVVGALGPGASRQTGAFTRARTCTYHDHGQDSNTALQGSIVVR
jgi:plastocyanin